MKSECERYSRPEVEFARSNVLQCVSINKPFKSSWDHSLF